MAGKVIFEKWAKTTTPAVDVKFETAEERALLRKKAAKEKLEAEKEAADKKNKIKGKKAAEKK